jgi:predicted DNA-binding ribbon-helix-helix protein
LSITTSTANFQDTNNNNNRFPGLNRRIEEITEGLQRFFYNQLKSISENNAVTICDYITSVNKEIILSQSHKKNNIKILCTFSKFVDNKTFVWEVF